MQNKKKQFDLIHDIAELFLSDPADQSISDKEHKAIAERIGNESLDPEYLKQLIYLLRAKSDKKARFFREWAHKSAVENYADGEPIPLPSANNLAINDYEVEALKRNHESLKKTGSRRGGQFSTNNLAGMKEAFNLCKDGKLQLFNQRNKPIEFGGRGFNAAMARYFIGAGFITNEREAQKKAKELLDWI